MTGLGIDAGGSSTRWLVLDEAETVVAQGRAGPITGHVFTPMDKEANLTRLREVLAAVLELAEPSAVVGGVTGLHGGTPAADLFVQEVAVRLELPTNRVHLDNDIGIAYASVFAPGEGILVYAGTGSVGYHVAADGQGGAGGGLRLPYRRRGRGLLDRAPGAQTSFPSVRRAGETVGDAVGAKPLP